MPRQRPLHPPDFFLSWADESDSPPLEQADWPMSIPPGAQLDFISLGSIQVTISHFPVMGEVHCEYQSKTVAQMSLTWYPYNWPDLNPWIHLTLKSSEQMQCPLANP